MKRKIIFAAILAVLMVGILIYILIAGEQLPAYDKIGNILSDYGYKVQEEVADEKGPNDNFDKIRIYKINGKEKISLCEYSSYSKAKKDIQILSGPLADWASTPFFFWKGRFIVIYVGEDNKLTSDLEKILGKQYTVG
jgi:hypothetical protein